MHHTIRTLAAAGIAAFALTSTAVEAPSAAAEPNRSRSCSFSFINGRPHVQTRYGESAVIGGGYADCVPGPERFHVTLTLEVRRYGNWEVRGATNDNQIPNPRLNIATWAPCEHGAWRVAAMITSTEDDEPHWFSVKTPATILGC
jgi:hypothetical protein